MNQQQQVAAHEYDRLFYEYQRQGSLRSARTLLPVVMSELKPHSVLDVGCGAGAWLAAYGELGLSDRIGCDGDYVDREMLLVEQSVFQARDITKTLDFKRSFDLVQCLEVAEHVPGQASDVLVDNLVRHGRHIMFSAAVPGQGGEEHINEQPYEFWRDLFARRGYRLFDFIRPRILDNPAIEPWYRYNILFFAHDSVIELLPSAVRQTRVADDAAIADFSPLAYRLRKAVVRILPGAVVTQLAVRKHRRFVRSLKA